MLVSGHVAGDGEECIVKQHMHGVSASTATKGFWNCTQPAEAARCVEQAFMNSPDNLSGLLQGLTHPPPWPVILLMH